MSTKKEIARNRRHKRIRSRLRGTEKKPRLVVTRTLHHIYAQLVNDDKGHILTASSDLTLKTKGAKSEIAKKVGQDIAKKGIEKKIAEVIFDRGGYKYHGRVKALADGAREGGLKF